MNIRFLAFILLFFPCSVFASVIYVSQTATGQNNGTSWANAYTDLHTALTQSQSGDEVWVAQGTYKTDSGTDRNRYFVLKSGVRLYGGFSGTETAIKQRNVGLFPTLLSGNIGNPADSTDNAYTILYTANPDANTRLDGLVFRHGYARSDTTTNASWPGWSGGAVYVFATNGRALLRFDSCTFLDNYAHAFGGAVYVRGSGGNLQSAPRFTNCIFTNNKTRFDGGAVFVTVGRGGNIIVENSRFIRNSAQRFGAGLYINHPYEGDSLILKDLLFEGNFSLGRGAAYFYGKGERTASLYQERCSFIHNQSNTPPSNIGSIIEIEAIVNVLYISNCQFVNNTFINSYGFLIGLVSNEFYLIYKDIYNFSIYILDNEFSGNGLYSRIPFVYGNEVVIRNNKLYDSEIGFLSYLGGGKKVEYSGNQIFRNTVSPEVSESFIFNIRSFDSIPIRCFNNTIVDNTYLVSPNAPILPQDYESLIDFKNNTIANNTFSQALPVFLQDTTAGFVNASNNIVFNNINLQDDSVIDQLFSPNSPVSFSNNLTDMDCATLPPNYTCGTGNIFNQDPIFEDPAAGDYRLRFCSPAINVGNNALVLSSTDIDGNPRILTGTVDMGAYEFTGTPIVPIAATEITPVICGTGVGGSILALSIDLSPPLQYLWEDASTDPLRTDLPPGDYTLTITDVRGCKASAAATVGLEGELSMVFLSDPIYCFGDSTSSIMATPQGGKEPFTWLWADGTNNIGISSIGAGTYTGTLTDAFGCKATWSIPITQPDSLSLSAQITPAATNQTANGSISVAATGGTGSYLYVWSNGGMTPSISGLLPGIYTLTLTDANGCTRTGAYEVKPLVGTSAPSSVVAVSAWPNPTAAWLYLDVPDGTLYEVQLTDGQGRIIGQVRAARYVTAWDLRTQPAGVYYWRVRTDAGVERSGRVVKE